MPFGRIDDDCAETRHEIAGDERAVLLLEYADMTARVSRRMQHAKIPAGLA